MKAASQPYAHKGAALVIILVLLLVVSLIAVGSYESAMLESRMVASSARIHETLENAEQGLLAGELAVRRITSDEAALDLDNEDAVYPLEGRGAIDPLDTDWSRIPFKASGQEPGIHYVIQYAGMIEVPAVGASGVIGQGKRGKRAPAHLFIITARAEIAGTVRLLQSIYVTAQAP